MSFRQLNLSSTDLCGVWGGWDGEQKPIDYRGEHGTYTAEGVTAIADALRVNSALASVKLRDNHLGDKGWGAIFAAICGNKDSKIMSMDASSEHIGPAGVKLIAEALRASVSTVALTSLDLSNNSLCGVWSKYGTVSGTYTEEGITAIAEALRVNGALTRVDVRHNNIAGDGAAQLSAAVLGNLKIKMFNWIPIKEMRAISITHLDLMGNGIAGRHGSQMGVVGGMVVAGLIPVMGGLTSVELRGNELGDEGWGAIFAAICGNKDSKIMSLDASSENISPAGVKLIAEALRMSVTGALTHIDVRRTNDIAGDCAEQLSAAVLGNLKIEMFNEIPIKEMRANSLTELDLNGKGVGVEGGMVVAGLIPLMGALTMLSLAKNRLGEGGTKAICEALEQNRTLKKLDISGSEYKQVARNLSSCLLDGECEDNIGGSAGAKHVAKMLGVNGGLTVANLLGNQLDAESAKLLAEVAKQKGISLCGIRRDQTTADFSSKGLQPPDAILLASDLSQAIVTGALTALDLYLNGLKSEGVRAVCKAIKSNKETKLASLNMGRNSIGPTGANAVAAMVAVTGGLTSIDLSHNQLCNIWTDSEGDQHGTYTAEGITAIADALRVNDGLTEVWETCQPTAS